MTKLKLGILLLGIVATFFCISLYKQYKIVNDGDSTMAVITGVTRKTIYYTYQVNGVYFNAKCGRFYPKPKVDDSIKVWFDPQNPNNSVMPKPKR